MLLRKFFKTFLPLHVKANKEILKKKIVVFNNPFLSPTGTFIFSQKFSPFRFNSVCFPNIIQPIDKL